MLKLVHLSVVFGLGANLPPIPTPAPHVNEFWYPGAYKCWSNCHFGACVEIQVPTPFPTPDCSELCTAYPYDHSVLDYPCDYAGFRAVHRRDGPDARMFVQGYQGSYLNRPSVDSYSVTLVYSPGLESFGTHGSTPAYASETEVGCVGVRDLIECPSYLWSQEDSSEHVATAGGPTLCGQDVVIYDFSHLPPDPPNSNLGVRYGVVTHYKNEEDLGTGASLALVGTECFLGDASTAIVIWEYNPLAACVSTTPDWDMCPGLENIDNPCPNENGCQCGGPLEPPCPAAFNPDANLNDVSHDVPSCAKCATIGDVNVMFVASNRYANGPIEVLGGCPSSPVVVGLQECSAIAGNLTCGNLEEGINMEDLCIDGAEEIPIDPDCGSSSENRCLAIIGMKTPWKDGAPTCGECGTIGDGEDTIHVRYIATDPVLHGIHVLSAPDNCPIFATIGDTMPCGPLVTCGTEGTYIAECLDVPDIKEDAACTKDDPCAATVGTVVQGLEPWPTCGDCGIVYSGDQDLYVMYVRETIDVGIYVPGIESCPSPSLQATHCDLLGSSGGASSAVLMTLALAFTMV